MAEPQVSPQALRQSLHRARRRGNPLAQTLLWRLEDADDLQREADAIMAELGALVAEHAAVSRRIGRLLWLSGMLRRRA